MGRPPHYILLVVVGHISDVYICVCPCVCLCACVALRQHNQVVRMPT